MKIIRTIWILLLLLGMQQMAKAQSQDDFVRQAPQIDSLLTMHKIINSIDTLVPGYRIQIFFVGGNFSKDKALEKAKEFTDKHPSQKAYLSFKAPYYRVRIGDFRNALEATAFLKKIEDSYPAAFIVKDKICFPPI